MKKIYSFIIILIALVVVISSCEDIFEDDLQGKSITILSPAEGASLSTGNVVFRWNFIDENENYHEKYNLVVVKPSFASISQVVLDTSIAINRFEMEMAVGDYEMFVFAHNASSRSDTTFRSFKVVDAAVKK